MHPIRRQRLGIVLFIVAGVAVAVGLALVALQENINLFYTPTQIATGEAPQGALIRAGGMVVENSVSRDPESLQVSFQVTDYAHKVTIHYQGILPDLFREGQGIVAQGRLNDNGDLAAVEVLAKHDEEYMPPEVADALEQAGTAKASQGELLMVPELGHLAVILALGMALLMATVPLIGAARGNELWMAYARPLAWGQFMFLAFSFVCLTHAFLTDDFSVQYVANNSNTALPAHFKFSAVWGAHEGSLLLWVLILAGWTFAVSLFTGNLPREMVARVLAVLGMVSIGFLLFVLLTSNPFDRLLPQSPVQGSELNPLLQDIGLIIHPPMLYMGYVGFSVAFAFAIAALIGGKLDATWARWSRPWTNMAWVFLTIGIALGSYWAYYELGWGGWWFWDPVENASFMPWLVGTALIHSLAVTDKRGAFKSWTLLLAIFAFSLSLLGTFLVRSGVLTSVHAFANDPERGLFILVFLIVVIGGSLTLYAVRAPAVVGKPLFSWWSREVLLLLNNVILVAAAVTVLLGTLYPLLVDALGGGRISVGPPYFNAMFVPLMSVLFALLGFAPTSKWKSSSRASTLRELLVAGSASLVVGLVFPVFMGEEYQWGASLAMVLSLWIVLTGGRDLVKKLSQTGGASGVFKLSRSYMGMQLAHFGLAICIIGVAFTSSYSDQRDVRMAPGDSVELGGYRFQFEGVVPVRGPNYKADEGQVRVFEGNVEHYLLKPQKRLYEASGQVMTEADFDAGVTRDLYVALGEHLGDGAWAVAIFYKAFIQWIWAGAFLTACGGLLAMTDRRYRIKRAAEVSAQPGVVPGR